MFEKVYIIAEAGSNHDGDLSKAIELVHAAKESGADAVKFQHYSLKTLFSPVHYTRTLKLPNEKWKHSINKYSFKPEWHEKIAEEAHKLKITYFSTPYSLEAVDILSPWVPFFKVASGDITFIPLLEKIADQGKGVFLSTGASKIEEIARAVAILEKHSLPFINIMHCIMLYPSPESVMNLNFIVTLSRKFTQHSIGFSDHSLGFQAAIAAISLGVRAIEKHFTLDSNCPGADHAHSLDPERFSQFVKTIRSTEQMLNSYQRSITKEEEKERIYARRGVYVKNTIHKDEIISLDKLLFLRPNTHIGAESVYSLIGKRAKVYIKEGSVLKYSMLSK